MPAKIRRQRYDPPFRPGSQFTNRKFQAALEQYGAIQSMSGTGRRYDNARMESFCHIEERETLSH